jgi:hypothetical protein
MAGFQVFTEGKIDRSYTVGLYAARVSSAAMLAGVAQWFLSHLTAAENGTGRSADYAAAEPLWQFCSGTLTNCNDGATLKWPYDAPQLSCSIK